jgi:ribosomal-protein-alanine N-acetyltransferase
MTAIETDRLSIRNFEAGDWQDLQEMVVQYQASEMAKYDHEWPTSTDEIKGIAGWFADGDRYLAVCLKATRKLIGFIALNPREREDSVEFGLGYCFNFDYHGEGYATEGCRAVIDHAFDQLAADRVVSSTAANNSRSCRLLRRLGMKETGRGTGSFRKRPDGHPIQFVSVTFAMSTDEWLDCSQASARSAG